MTTADATTLAITGVTGGLGGRVARRLAERGVPIRLVVRDPPRAPDLPGTTIVRAEYADADAMRAALAGVDTLFLVSATETDDRVHRHITGITAAARAGVRRIVYTSFLGAGPTATFTLARHHWHTEEHIRGTGVAYTMLRDALYQDVLPTYVGRDGVIRGPAGNGRCGFVSRDDIADAAVAVLLDGSGMHDGQTYDLTGPQSLTFADVAELLTTHAGREIGYHPQTLAQAYASRAQYVAPEWMVEGWVSTYVAVQAGELDLVTRDVEQLTGRPATSFAEFLAANADAVAHLRPPGS